MGAEPPFNDRLEGEVLAGEQGEFLLCQFEEALSGCVKSEGHSSYITIESILPNIEESKLMFILEDEYIICLLCRLR